MNLPHLCPPNDKDTLIDLYVYLTHTHTYTQHTQTHTHTHMNILSFFPPISLSAGGGEYVWGGGCTGHNLSLGLVSDGCDPLNCTVTLWVFTTQVYKPSLVY